MKNYFFIFLLIAFTGCAGNSKNSMNTSVIEPNDANSIEENDFEKFEEEMGEAKLVVQDPLEGFNRFMFSVNDKFYLWVANPVIKTYKNAVPKNARTGIVNFFDNIKTPIRLVSCLAQGKGQAANIELKRFGINTTAGVLGFGDPARDRYNLIAADEDLGQTLAVYGFGNGFYIVWPLLGPSTLRDSVGKAGDIFLNPIWYIEPDELSIGLSAGDYVNRGSFNIGEYESFKEAAIDPYIAMRQAYLQYRENLIKQTGPAAEPNSGFDFKL